MIVWVDDWQLQCCGTPFGRGDRVTWRVQLADTEWLGEVFGPRLPDPPLYAEEHHGGASGRERTTAAGTVRSIDAVSCRFAPREAGGLSYPVYDSAVLEPVAEADGWHRAAPPLKFAGYLVTLEAEAAAG
ncbi:MAG: DUF6578 domain-containing protein [Mycobacteriales bacterium]